MECMQTDKYFFSQEWKVRRLLIGLLVALLFSFYYAPTKMKFPEEIMEIKEKCLLIPCSLDL
jgi:hypothetical protein